MKTLSQHLLEHMSTQVNEASVIFSKNEIVEKIENDKYVKFDDLKDGLDAQNTGKEDEVYTIIAKYSNIETARANNGDDIDNMLEKYTKALVDAPNFASSLPVVKVEHNGKELIYIYSPDKFDSVETLVVLTA